MVMRVRMTTSLSSRKRNQLLERDPAQLLYHGERQLNVVVDVEGDAGSEAEVEVPIQVDRPNRSAEITVFTPHPSDCFCVIRSIHNLVLPRHLHGISCTTCKEKSKECKCS